ncbi:putative WRKY transcription factor 46 [Raphanus sativus]|nr:putative WRKY transcription factor 46 [Raphanus sativus]
MSMEEKLVVKELEQGKELANQLMNSLNNPSSPSKESNEILISEILRCFENTIHMMVNLGKKTLKRSHERSDQSNKKRIFEKKKTEEVEICVGTGQEGTPLDDGYCWRKYGQKDIHGSKYPRGYYRCTHRLTRGCLAVKQVQKSDTNPLCYEVKYVESHTCDITPSTTKHSIPVFQEQKLHDAKQSDDNDTVKHMKPEELMISIEDLDYKKEIFRTFSFSNPEIDDFLEWNDLMENLSPTTSESGITNEFHVSPTDDSCFSSLENILGSTHDLSWM